MLWKVDRVSLFHHITQEENTSFQWDESIHEYSSYGVGINVEMNSQTRFNQVKPISVGRDSRRSDIRTFFSDPQNLSLREQRWNKPSKLWYSEFFTKCIVHYQRQALTRQLFLSK